MALPQLVSRNGRLIAPADAHISIFNPVIFGAFGVYESIQLCQGVCFRLDDHLQRLADSAAAIAHQLDPALVEAVAWRESRLRHGAVSPAGATGVMQLMPGTARDLGVDARDLRQNIHGGAAYLSRMIAEA